MTRGAGGALGFGLRADGGSVFVAAVAPGSPAAAAGLQPDLVLTEINGLDVLDAGLAGVMRAIKVRFGWRFTW